MKIVSIPIDMIAIFRRNEYPTPYRFFYTNEEGRAIDVVVEKQIDVERTNIAGVKAIVYSCSNDINGKTKSYELKFIVTEARWELYKA